MFDMRYECNVMDDRNIVLVLNVRQIIDFLK